MATAIATSARADFTGRVVAVLDGDSIIVRDGTRETEVRLVDIDAPERGQPYGGVAKRSLQSRIAGRDVRVAERGVDGFGRTLARVFVNELDVNAAQVQSGNAWVFRRYASDATLVALENEAKAARRGLWRDSAPVPPWLWRDEHGKRALSGTAMHDRSERPVE